MGVLGRSRDQIGRGGFRPSCRLSLPAHGGHSSCHPMLRCSFPEADINWSSNFSIHKRLSMRSCTTRTLHVSRAIAIPEYAAQVSVRAGSVIAHLASLNRDGPIPDPIASACEVEGIRAYEISWPMTLHRKAQRSDPRLDVRQTNLNICTIRIHWYTHCE